MAAAVDQNFRMNVGEDRTIVFTVAGENLTSGEVVWVMRAHELSSPNTLSVAGTSLGNTTFSVVLADTLTDSVNPGVYYHEAKYTTAGGAETIVVRGSVQLDPSIT